MAAARVPQAVPARRVGPTCTLPAQPSPSQNRAHARARARAPYCTLTRTRSPARWEASTAVAAGQDLLLPSRQGGRGRRGTVLYPAVDDDPDAWAKVETHTYADVQIGMECDGRLASPSPAIARASTLAPASGRPALSTGGGDGADLEAVGRARRRGGEPPWRAAAPQWQRRVSATAA